MTKKLLACLLAVCLTATTISITAFAEKTPQAGIDLPGDPIGEVGVERGDVNGDDQVNSDDAVYLLMYTMFPTEYPLAPDAPKQAPVKGILLPEASIS